MDAMQCVHIKWWDYPIDFCNNKKMKKISWARNESIISCESTSSYSFVKLSRKKTSMILLFFMPLTVKYARKRKFVCKTWIYSRWMRAKIIISRPKALEIFKRYNLQWTHFISLVKWARRSRKLRYKNFTTQPTTWACAGKPSRTF